jgi:hypothetical protein
MSGQTDGAAWATTEAAVRAFYKDKHGWTVERVDRTALPALVTAVFSDGAIDTVVVGGRVLEDKGVAALGKAARANHLLTVKQADAATVLRLVDAVGAQPAASTPSWLQLPEAGDPALLPRFDRTADGGARLVLNYLLQSRGPSHDREANVEEWTLTIRPSYEAAWSARTVRTRLSGAAP